MPTHGSLTKAGKVRAQTPKIEPQPRTHLAPKRKTRSKLHQESRPRATR